jgi:hypothetical protein
LSKNETFSAIEKRLVLHYTYTFYTAKVFSHREQEKQEGGSGNAKIFLESGRCPEPRTPPRLRASRLSLRSACSLFPRVVNPLKGVNY